MNTTSVDTTPAPAQRTARDISAFGKFTWLLRREFWENRGGFVWAPVITGIIMVVLYALLMAVASFLDHGQINRGIVIAGDPDQKIHAIAGSVGDVMLLTGIGLAGAVLAFVVFFYALCCLYDDRRDRSVLFWKSLPLSDTQTVLSKLTWALLLAPLLALVVGILIGLAMWLITALTMTVNGLPASGAIFTYSHPLRVVGQVVSALPIYIAWAMPTVGWLMFCSAWARSKPFLWAALVPILACIIVSIMYIPLGSSIGLSLKTVWYVVVARGLFSVIPGLWYAALGRQYLHGDLNGQTMPGELINAIHLSGGWHAFATADLWIGVVIGAAFIAAAIWLRRHRDDN